MGIWDEIRPIRRFQRDSIGRLCGVMCRSMFKSVKLARQRMMLSSKSQQHHCIQSQSSQKCGIRYFKTEQLSTTVTTGGFTSSTPIQECGFVPSFISPDKVAPSPISIPQENKPLGPPTKSAPVRLQYRYYLRHTRSHLVTPIDHAESTY